MGFLRRRPNRLERARSGHALGEAMIEAATEPAGSQYERVRTAQGCSCTRLLRLGAVDPAWTLTGTDPACKVHGTAATRGAGE